MTKSRNSGVEVGHARQRVSRRDFIKTFGATATVAWVGGSGLLGPELAWAEGNQRPIGDFLSKQGTTKVFLDPVRDVVGWLSALQAPPQRRAPVRFAVVDYCGFADEYLRSVDPDLALGTTMDGSIRERPLKDGRVEVTVILHTKAALTFARNVTDLTDPNPSDDPPDFGSHAVDVVNGAEPALGDSNLKVVLRNTAPGADLPDLVDAFILGNAGPGQELLALGFHADARGPLHASFGVSEGTPGKCVVAQTGIFFTNSQSKNFDGFPAERVDLMAIGFKF
jgi:hypothetical protein